MSTAVLIPWRHSEERAPLWYYVRDRYRELGWQLYVSDDLHENDDLFNHGQAYNLAAELAADSDVLVLGDADTTYSDAEALQTAVERVRREDWAWALPETYVQLTEAVTHALLTGAPLGWALAARPHWAGTTSWAGVIVVSTAAFFKVGGSDERYVGHGADDAALGIKLDTLHGAHTRYPMSAVHLWHSRGNQEEDMHRHSAAQRELTFRYMNAAGDPEAVRQVASG